MDSARTKTIELDGSQYVIRRLTPFVGSYIWQRLVHAIALLQQEQPERSEQKEPTEGAGPKPAPEDRLRGVCALGFMKLTSAELREVQEESMKVLSRTENGVPMPVMTQEGRWTPGQGLEDNPFLVTKLTVEVLVYNLIGFFAETGS